jgi:hypothetical protein
MTVTELIDFYGSEVKVAAALNLNQATVRRWRINNNIPWLTQLAVEHLTKGKLKADEN